MISNNPYNNNFVSGGYFYNPIQRDITMVKADTLSFAFQVQGLKGQRPDMIYLSVKAAIEDTNLLFNISSDDYIKFREYDEENDLLTYVVRIPPYLTADIDLGRYFYDLEMQVNGDNITLMKGRFTLDYQITGDNPEPPIYENGDTVRYPTTTETGVVKLYTEEYISDIGQGIIDINGLSQRYTTQEMSGALADIKTEIDNIRATLAISCGTDPNIPLDEIADVVSADNIVSKFEYCKNWFSRYNESRSWLKSGLAYFPNNSTYGMIPTQADVHIGIKGGISYDRAIYAAGLAINNATTNQNVGNRQNYASVLDNFVPYWLTDYSNGVFGGYNTPVEDLAILDSGYIQIAELNEEGSLPALVPLLANERECSVTEFKDKLLYNILFTDLVDTAELYEALPCSQDSIFGGCFINMNSETGALILFSTEGSVTHGVGTYDPNTGKISGVSGYYAELPNPINRTMYAKVNPRIQWNELNGWMGANSIEQWKQKYCLTTEPVKDSNNNIIIPANYTKEKLGF